MQTGYYRATSTGIEFIDTILGAGDSTDAAAEINVLTPGRFVHALNVGLEPGEAVYGSFDFDTGDDEFQRNDDPRYFFDAAQIVYSDFGAVEIEGLPVQISSQPSLTNRVFSGWWGDAADGDSYLAEYQADGITQNGEQVKVTWRFDVTKGDEPEDESDYPWEDEQHITITPA